MDTARFLSDVSLERARRPFPCTNDRVLAPHAGAISPKDSVENNDGGELEGGAGRDSQEPDDVTTPSEAEGEEASEAFTRLFVAHSKQVEPQVLVYLFSNREGFKFIDVKRNRRTQRSLGVSLVTFQTHAHAVAAREALHDRSGRP